MVTGANGRDFYWTGRTWTREEHSLRRRAVFENAPSRSARDHSDKLHDDSDLHFRPSITYAMVGRSHRRAMADSDDLNSAELAMELHPFPKDGWSSHEWCLNHRNITYLGMEMEGVLERVQNFRPSDPTGFPDLRIYGLCRGAFAIRGVGQLSD